MELSFRVLQLERKVETLMAGQTPTRRPFKLTLSAQKGEYVGKVTKGEHLFERILKDFQKFRLGSRSGKKDAENARQSASHGLRFCMYKASGLPTNGIAEDLRFLTQIDKLRGLRPNNNKKYAQQCHLVSPPRGKLVSKGQQAEQEALPNTAV